MSRTYRRKTDNGSWHKYWATTKWIGVVGVWERVPLEGEELKKSLAEYHSDRDYNSSPTKSWRRGLWHKFRQQSKQELIRWIKNSEHEVQIRDNPRWPWWD